MEAAGAALGGQAVAVPGAVARERVAALVLRYFVASTAVLLVAGLLGVVMRQSQANIAPLPDNTFYAFLTAHGLGAFVAWAGFGIMGFGYWVLHTSGFQMRPLGYRIADATWWFMVVGTAGIVVTTVLFGFGGSWVFLYPLPFFSAGQWGDTTTAFFLASVLLAGLAIITWCVSILHTTLGPSLTARGSGLLTRMGAAIGLGYVWPNRFGTERRLPYAVIPLTVIAIDMIIATLPLALLLIQQIIQAFDASFTVDPLLAKNVLWWFGHPVVYLLLFPAVSVYYLLIPRYAKRPLVAGNVIALVWLLGVIVNVIIWAHHVYLDYPEGTIQAQLNVAMQPLTYSIAIVSVLSIYSLSATIYKSDFEWTPASKFLVAALFSWFTAGISGVVNATIAFQESIHNTLWVVGHFHHMALLNIGFVVFAAAYAFVPELTGKQLYSRRLADWQLGAMLIGGYGAFFAWLVQGLEGAPRRFALLPKVYDPWTVATLPFVLLMAVGGLLFAYNMAQTLAGRVRRDDEQSILSDGRQLALGSVCAIAIVVPLFAVGLDRWVADQDESAKSIGPDLRGPGQVFASTCGGCHTLGKAGTSGAVGPNLDRLKPGAALVARTVANGRGAMPAGLLRGKDLQQVSSWVASNAGK